jgi:ketosteroid isomerase-like protein
LGEEHPNEAIARQLWAGAAEGDAEAIRGVLAAGVVWKSVGRNPLSGEFRGPEAVIDYMARVGESTDELRLDLTDLFVNEGGVVVLYHASALRGARRLELDYVLVLRIRDGLVVDALSVPVDQPRNDAFWV